MIYNESMHFVQWAQNIASQIPRFAKTIPTDVTDFLKFITIGLGQCSLPLQPTTMRMVSRNIEGRNIFYFMNLLHSNKHLDMRRRGSTSLLPKRGIAKAPTMSLICGRNFT